MTTYIPIIIKDCVSLLEKKSKSYSNQFSMSIRTIKYRYLPVHHGFSIFLELYKTNCNPGWEAVKILNVY